MRDARRAFPVVFLGLLALVPVVAHLTGEPYYLTVFSRIMVFGLAALGLNLILGFGGLVSFGHALYLGIGAYAVGILSAHGVTSGFAHLGAALAVGAVAALLIGLVCLRTSGMAFIMITLAFAQMIYYIAVGMRAYGGEEGLNLPTRSQLGFGLDLKDDVTFYYLVLAILAAALYALRRTVGARFGRVIEAIRENETRMDAIGFPTYRYKLVCFALGGALAGLAGALLANQNSYVNPNLLYWTQSGTLMIMVILGGVGYLYGGVLGAVALLVLEEVVSGYTIHWQLGVGAVMLAIVLFAPRGLAGLAQGRRDG